MFVVFADPVLTGRVFVGRDLLGYHLPMERAVHDAWSRGRLPVWISEISGGRPLAANPNVGALYPVRALLAPLPFPFSLGFFCVLHWAVAGLGAMSLARSLGLSVASCWMAAVTYAFSGVALTDYTYTNLQRCFDRQTLREFDMRVLLQMSMTDSSSLIDLPVAAKLGPSRAIYFTEDQGRVEKFRPYALPTPEWVRSLVRVAGNGAVAAHASQNV